MVNRLDNDTSFSSFADYQLDDELFQHDDDDDSSSSSTSSVDLANEIDSGMIGFPARAYNNNNSHGDDLLDESSASGGTGDELFTTPAKPSTTIMPKDDPRRCHPPAVRKTVRFGSQEIRYFIALPNGQIHVTEHQVQSLLPEPALQQRRRQRQRLSPTPKEEEETKKKWSISIAAKDDRWRPYRASSLLMCRQPARR
jgi:hypothetical protein